MRKRDAPEVRPAERVEYELPSPNSGLPLRGRLGEYIAKSPRLRGGRGVCEVDGSPLETFLSPVLCERIMRRDPVLQKIADEMLGGGPLKVGSRREAVALSRLKKRLLKTTAVAMLEDAYTRLEASAEDMVRYYLAFRAAELTHPGRFLSPDEEEADAPERIRPATQRSSGRSQAPGPAGDLGGG